MERPVPTRTWPAGDRFTVKPPPGTGGSCPRCHEPLRVTRIRFPGWRILLDGKCETCKHRYLQAAPAGPGLLSPASLDLTVGEVLVDGGADWFAKPLFDQWSAPDRRPVAVRIDHRRAVADAVLLNCLDP